MMAFNPPMSSAAVRVRALEAVIERMRTEHRKAIGAMRRDYMRRTAELRAELQALRAENKRIIAERHGGGDE